MSEVRPARVVDLTAYRLEKMLHEHSHDAYMHQALLDILGDYYLGLIAIGWEDGEPVVMSMDVNNIWTRGIPPGFSMVGMDPASIVDKSKSDFLSYPPPMELEPPEEPWVEPSDPEEPSDPDE